MESSSSLAIRREGQGIPIVIVHGWMVDSSIEIHDFEPIFGTIEGYERIYVDLPGMGKSPANGVASLDSIFDRVDQFIEQNILPNSFLLTGSSCGGYLARALALKHSSKVLGLLLRVPVVQPHSPNRDVSPCTPIVSNPVLIDQLSPSLREEMGFIPFQTAEYIATLERKLAVACWPANAAADKKALDPIREDPAKYVLSKAMHSPTNPFNAPTLIINGRQDTDVGYRDASSRQFLDSYPRATAIALDGATHALPVTDGEKLVFKALVLDWLSRVNEHQQSSP